MDNLATKYRPKTFSEVCGQAMPVNVLKRIASYDGIAARAVFLHGSWGSGKCVSPDTVIKTDDGLKLASLLSPNTSFEIAGEKSTIVAIADNRDCNCIGITTKSGKTFKVTYNHPVLVWSNNSFCFKRADAIKIDDVLVQDLTKIPFDGEIDDRYFLTGYFYTNGSTPLDFNAVNKLLSLLVSSKIDYDIENDRGFIRIKLNEESIKDYKVCIDSNFYGLSFINQASFVMGFLERHAFCHNDHIKLMNFSPKLSNYIINTLSSMGYVCSLSESILISKFSTESYDLFPISNRTIQPSEFGYFEGVADNYKKFFLGNDCIAPDFLNCTDSLTYNQASFINKFINDLYLEDYVFIPNCLPDPVVCIKPCFEDYTIDIQCTGGHIFSTDGIITHNTTITRLFGKALNCREFKTKGDVCNECDGCKDASAKNSQLYYEFDSSVVGNVDGIQKIDALLQTIPNGRRCVVLDEVHSCSKQALNALLKMVEEGRTDTIFVFASTEMILPTLMSRSICLDITTIPVNLIKDRILEVSDKESISITDEEALAIAYKSGGHMRDALSLLQLFALAGKDAIDTAISAFDSFICKCIQKTASKEDIMLVLKYPISNVVDSINQYIISLYSKDEKYQKVASTGIQSTLFNYFYSPVVCQALKSEAGIQIALTNLMVKLCNR